MSDQDWLKLELQSEGIMLVTMQNAPVNALNPSRLEELESIFSKLADDTATKAVVLASDLKVFSAGLNLREAQHYDLDAQKAIVDAFHKTFLEIFAFPKPLIVGRHDPVWQNTVMEVDLPTRFSQWNPLPFRIAVED